MRSSCLRKWSVVAACVVGQTAMGAGPATSSAPAASQPQAAPAYQCGEPIHKLKGVWSGDRVQHAFVIENRGRSPLQITHLEAGCSCLVAEDYPRVIPPGEKGKIRVSLTTARGATEVHKELEVETNDPEHPKNLLVIEGRLTPRIEVDPIFGANWGRLYPGDELTKVVRLTNHFTKPMKLELSQEQTHADYTVVLKHIEPGRLAELTVVARKGLPEGSHMQFVHAKTGFDEEPELIVPCTLYVPPEFEATHIAFSVFGLPGQVDKQTLMLRWNGESPMGIESAAASDPRVQTEIKAREAGRVYILTVTMPSGYEPPSSGEIEIRLKTSLKERSEIKIPIRPRTLEKATTAGSP